MVPGRPRASYPPAPVRKATGRLARRVGKTSLPAPFVNELRQLTQPLQVKEMRSGDARRGSQRARGVVGRAERNGGMAAIGQTDDDIRTRAVADSDDG